jgi:hypothetical protein
LIDFPKVDCVYTPHLDLARFKFSLELIKQFPPSKLLGFDRWNVDELFNRFMTRYCSELSIVPNKDDMWLIECFRKANIRRARNLKRKGKCGLQPILERAYLEAFSRNWLYQ